MSGRLCPSLYYCRCGIYFFKSINYCIYSVSILRIFQVRKAVGRAFGRQFDQERALVAPVACYAEYYYLPSDYPNRKRSFDSHSPRKGSYGGAIGVRQVSAAAAASSISATVTPATYTYPTVVCRIQRTLLPSLTLPINISHDLCFRRQALSLHSFCPGRISLTRNGLGFMHWRD